MASSAGSTPPPINQAALRSLYENKGAVSQSEAKGLVEGTKAASSQSLTNLGNEFQHQNLSSIGQKHSVSNLTNLKTSDKIKEKFYNLLTKISNLWSNIVSRFSSSHDKSYIIDLDNAAKEIEKMNIQAHPKNEEAAKQTVKDLNAFLSNEVLGKKEKAEVNSAAPLERTEEERGIEAAKNLEKQIKMYLQPAYEKALALANPSEKEALMKAHVALYTSLEALEIQPNDANTTKLLESMSGLNKATDSVMKRAGAEKKEILAKFRNDLASLKEKIPPKDVKYTLEKEVSGQWIVFTTAKNQLNQALIKAENDAVLYETGKNSTFDGQKHLEDIGALTNKLNEAIANYNR